MSEKAERISYLIFAHIKGSLTADERQELNDFINASAANKRYFDEMVEEGNAEKMLAEFGEPDKLRIWQKITEKAPDVIATPVIQKKWWRYAAAAVIVLGVGSWFLFSNRDGKADQTTLADNSTIVHDIPPGTDKAVLTLSNGQTMVLDSKSTGTVDLGIQSTTAHLGHNIITYESATTNTSAPVAYNTITTPRGAQYQLVLPDQTKVYINAGSSIRYPTSFSSNTRQVELAGEAFFEVASQYDKQNKKIPFIVNIQNAQGKPQGSVHVLGTQFNVMAYAQSDIKTTLTEGSVKMMGTDGQSALIKPGQQAKISIAGGSNPTLTVVPTVDVEEVIAWKNGMFQFNNASIQTIMEYVSRWYDVDVIYETDTPVHFTFTLSRGLPVSKLLEILQMTGSIHFKIEGKTIRVVK